MKNKKKMITVLSVASAILLGGAVILFAQHGKIQNTNKLSVPDPHTIDLKNDNPPDILDNRAEPAAAELEIFELPAYDETMSEETESAEETAEQTTADTTSSETIDNNLTEQQIVIHHNTDEASSQNTTAAQSRQNISVTSDTTASEPELRETEPPAATEPTITESEVTEPEVTEPAVTEPAVTEPTETEPAETEPPVQRDEPLAMDFIVYTDKGSPVKLSDYFGKPIVLNFWASWCGPCKHEMPAFNEMYLALGDEVHFLMVNLTGFDTLVSAKGLVDEQGYTFPVFYDFHSEAANTYSVQSLPTTYFIDADGYLIAKAVGAISKETIQQGVDMIR